MPGRRVLPYTLALSASLVCFSFSAFANTNQIFVKTYPLAKGGQFALDNINGSVQVEGWDRDEVEVRAVKTSQADSADPSKVKIEVENRPTGVAVHTRYPADEGGEVAVEYHIRVPYRALLGIDVPTYQPNACPLCAQGLPVVKPGSRPVAA